VVLALLPAALASKMRLLVPLAAMAKVLAVVSLSMALAMLICAPLPLARMRVSAPKVTAPV
jgi:hypothetical protein